MDTQNHGNSAPQDAGKPSLQLELVGDVRPGANMPSDKVLTKLGKLATDAHNLANKALGAYRELCAFIREQQIEPSVVRAALTQRNYTAPRIAEIVRVSNVPDEIFAQYMRGDIGMKVVLEGARKAARQERIPETARTEAERFRGDMQDVLERYLPAVGEKPKWLKAKFRVRANGFEVMVTIGARKTAIE